MSTNCFFCNYAAAIGPLLGDRYDVTCPICGDYSIVDSALAMMRTNPMKSFGAVSGWIRQHNAMGITPRIGSQDLERLRALKKPSFRERAERCLLAIADRLERLDKFENVMTPELFGISCSDDNDEGYIIIRYLEQEGLLEREHEPQVKSKRYATLDDLKEHRRLTPKGYMTADDLRTKRGASAQAFVAMWFSDDMERAYQEGFEPGIDSAGFRAMRLLDKEHANKIDDEIIAEIRRSPFLVADFTGHRQNVYLETGFALGLGLPVIWTCHKRDAGGLHFDIRQYNYIDWENGADLARRLQRRIEAMFGQGPLRA